MSELATRRPHLRAMSPDLRPRIALSFLGLVALACGHRGSPAAVASGRGATLDQGANPERGNRIVERLRSGGCRRQQPAEGTLDVADTPVGRYQGLLRSAQADPDPAGHLADPPGS